jgi:hypothetical protein
MTPELHKATLSRLLTDIEAFSRHLLPERALRPYQLAPARAIIDSVVHGRGDQLAIVFSRQSGKDELLAQVISFLLMRYTGVGGSIVVAAPTLEPQATISRDRLRTCLHANPLGAPMMQGHGATIELGAARAAFVSASPGANARGQTASLLLIANEAQDIAPDQWDAVFDPMAASTNATTVYLGTVWSQHTLLARQMRHLRELEAVDGRQRVFEVPWETVAETLPAYGDRVRARIAQLGGHHPFIRTEYCLEELEGEGGLFPPHRIAQIQGEHPRLHRARPGYRYALLLDVGGEEESGSGPLAFASHGRRDSTALTVVEVDTTARADGQPVYRVVDRRAWTGICHSDLHEHLVALARSVWKASWVVVDATGVGADLASFLDKNLSARPAVKVVPVTFSVASKSRMGWGFTGLIDAGRFLEYDPGDAPDEVTVEYQRQLRNTTYEVLNGPGSMLRWSVPARLGHDDLVVSAALVTALDELDLRPRIARGAPA